VDSPFVPGNSGGPVILSKTDLVIGVATHLEIIRNPEVSLIGSRYEVKRRKPAVRRFATRIDDIDLAKLERVTLEQIRADYTEYAKILKFYNEFLTIIQGQIDLTSIEELKKMRFRLPKYRTTRKWNSTYLGKEYEKKYKLLDEILKKIFPEDEYNFSMSQTDRHEKLKQIWNKHQSGIKIKIMPIGFEQCKFCRGSGEFTSFIEKDNPGKLDKYHISKKTCTLCNGKGKFPIRPATRYVMFSKVAIAELTSVIEPEKREICGLRLGRDCVQVLSHDKKYKKNFWKVARDGCFRILRYPGNSTFPEAIETRFYFFGKKLMHVELYFPIVDEKNAVRTEINFYKKYLPGCNDSNISVLLQYHQKIQHPQISNDRVHLSADVFNFFNNQLKKNAHKMPKSSLSSKRAFTISVPEEPIETPYSYLPDFISEKDFQDPVGMFMAHRTWGRGCICEKNGVDVKKYLKLTISHPDYDFVKNLLTDSLSGIQF
jgi:hypothetical protein